METWGGLLAGTKFQRFLDLTGTHVLLVEKMYAKATESSIAVLTGKCLLYMRLIFVFISP